MVQDLWMPKVNEMERGESFGRLLDMAKGQAGDNRRYVRECAKNWQREVAQSVYEMCIKPVDWIERHVGPVKVRKPKTVTGDWDPFADRQDIRLQDGVNFISGTSDSSTVRDQGMSSDSMEVEHVSSSEVLQVPTPSSSILKSSISSPRIHCLPAY
ncbi:hypothetical protein ACOMHN_033044 [Nucella lapillus]